MFRIGQKVACIETSPGGDVVKGQIYTVSWIAPHGRFLAPTIRVVEVPCHPETGGFWAERFRPIVEHKTDISFAHEILRKASKPAKAPARAKSLIPSADRA